MQFKLDLLMDEIQTVSHEQSLTVARVDSLCMGQGKLFEGQERLQKEVTKLHHGQAQLKEDVKKLQQGQEMLKGQMVEMKLVQKESVGLLRSIFNDLQEMKKEKINTN